MFRARFGVSARFMLVLAIGFIFQAGISAASLSILQQSHDPPPRFEARQSRARLSARSLVLSPEMGRISLAA
jgi:hypothetical protein